MENATKFPAPTERTPLTLLLAWAESASDGVKTTGAKVIAATRKGRRTILMSFIIIALLPFVSLVRLRFWLNQLIKR